MNLVKIIFLFIILFSCSAPPKTQYTYTNSTGNSDNTYPAKKDPEVTFNLLDEVKKNNWDLTLKGMETRRPYVLYYAVDSDNREPFMKSAIDHETDQLRNSCNGKKHQNWMIVRNSDFIKGGYVEYCLGGRISKKYVNFATMIFEKFIKYNRKNFPIKCYDKNPLYDCKLGYNYKMNHLETTFNSAILNIKKELNLPSDNVIPEYNLMEMYHKFPISMKLYFLAFLNESVNPFSKSEFVPIVHIKSHGHIDYAITGLTDRQIKTKWDKQLQMLKKKDPYQIGLTSPIPKFKNKVYGILKNLGFDYSQQISLNLSQDETECSGLSVASSISIDEQGQYMSATSDSGLSVGNLFLGNHIGLTPNDIFEVISGAFNNERMNSIYSSDFTLDSKLENKSIFMFVEACDAEMGGARWPLNSNKIKQQIPAIYSADGSMWYRNLDWDVIFNVLDYESNEKLHATILQSLLIELTKDITLFKSKEREAFVSNYDKVLDKFKEFMETQFVEISNSTDNQNTDNNSKNGEEDEI